MKTNQEITKVVAERINDYLIEKGMNIKQFSEYFEIPYRTVQNWKSGSRKCPDYVLKLILYRLENENKKRGE